MFWLPQYHDFGLISVILSTLAGNSHTYLMSPITFLQRPAVWFEVMSRVAASLSPVARNLLARRTSSSRSSGS